MAKPKIRVKLLGADAHTAYIYLPGHGGTKPGTIARTLNLDEIVANYKGPRVHLDFNSEGEMIGIEVLVSTSERRTPS
jgi:hypothetical protein